MLNKTTLLTILFGSTFISSPALSASVQDTIDRINAKADRVYTITEGNDSDYSFTAVEDGVTKYYKINLKTANIGTSKNISWNTDSTGAIGSVKVNFPSEDNPTTLYYTESGYKEVQTNRLTSLTSDIGSADEKHLFKDIKNASSSGGVYGGAIYNTSTNVANIYADFIGNYVSSTSSSGGAIYNNGTIKNITGDFIGNYASSPSPSKGGAIYNGNDYGTMTIDNITGDFIGNYASFGGAIYNYKGTIVNITGDFIGNYASSGGAIYNQWGTIKNIVNSSFINNCAKSETGTAQGGAIWSYRDILIKADNGESLFSGNYAETNGVKKSNAIYMYYADLKLSSVNNGTITFDDGIDGINYNINIKTDESSVIKFNNTVDNVKTFTMNDGSVVHLGLNGVINAQDMSLATSSRISTNSLSSPIITVDVEVDKAQNKVNSGKINLSGDVSGDYRILVNSLNPDVLNNLDDAIVSFLTALNDDANTASSFSVARVIGSPYLWDGDVNVKGEESGSTWYLNLSNTVNPDYDPNEPTTPDNPNNPVTPNKPVVRAVTPEVIAGIGLHEAAIEQTRSVVRNVSGKVASGREYCPGCGIYPTSWDSKALRNVWVMAQGESANLDKPADMAAKIGGVEGGFDLLNDVNNTLGVFASYRKGEYDLSGKGSKYYSKLGSEIDIDSYLAGLYYRYDKNMNWLFATVYGGVQQADVKTDDGMSKFDSDGVELGAGLEAGHSFALSKSLTLDPSLGVYYTQISFDKAHDNVGKSYKWDDIKHVEAEAAVKLSQQFENAKVYVKPSLIQTYTDGDSVKISGLNKADTYHDQTLGRIEIGGNYGFTDSLNGYVWSNYTYGSSYDSTAAGLGINYAW